MIPPILAVSAATTALGMISSLAESATTKRNDQLDQKDFLTLLVAQLKSQDPLNPLDSADFSAQLAQFSSLEQLMQINQRLGTLGDRTAGIGGLDPVGFLGREVSVEGSSLVVSDGQIPAVDYTLEQAGRVTLEIRDASGSRLATLDLGEQSAGAHRADVGSLAGAPSLADGTYATRLTVSGTSGGPTEVKTRTGGRVTGVDLSADPPVLLIGDRRVALTDIREVREPAGVA